MPERLSIADLIERADRYRSILEQVKSRSQPGSFHWYPYDSLGNFVAFRDVLKGEHQFPLDLAGDNPVLDLGCGDGDLAFFLESLGCRVHAIDHPATNCNYMYGVRTMKAALQSDVEIFEADLDQSFALPGERYGLAVFFGVLYHLKNPFGVLEALAKRCRYCLLSTRVTRLAPDRRTELQNIAVGYLLDEAESNNDPTNYWIFSEAGLRRILSRTGWEVCAWTTEGETSASDPATLGGDERAFCLIRSERLSKGPFSAIDVADSRFTDQLGPTWYGNDGGFRWMPEQASVILRGPDSPGQSLYLGGYCAAEQLQNGPLRLHVSAGGHELPPVVLDEPGRAFHLCFPLPRELVGRPNVEITVRVDRTFTPPGDQRRLGIAFGTFEIR